jgi:hypothetical protein
MSDGREFQLRFNCAKCQMEVLNGNVNVNDNKDNKDNPLNSLNQRKARLELLNH